MYSATRLEIGFIPHTPGSVLNVHLYVSDVIEGMRSDEDKLVVQAFVEHIEEWALANKIDLNEKSFQTCIDSAMIFQDVDPVLSNVLTEGSILSALWVIFLRVYRMSLLDESIFKYKNIREFLSEYSESLSGVDESHYRNLYYTAQWMALCQKMIPGTRKKTFYMHVIPKLIEGFATKYVTGSGQSTYTSWRVSIFEKESGTKKWTRSSSKRKCNCRAAKAAAQCAVQCVAQKVLCGKIESPPVESNDVSFGVRVARTIAMKKQSFSLSAFQAPSRMKRTASSSCEDVLAVIPVKMMKPSVAAAPLFRGPPIDYSLYGALEYQDIGDYNPEENHIHLAAI
jgi:hypothetical protein